MPAESGSAGATDGAIPGNGGSSTTSAGTSGADGSSGGDTGAEAESDATSGADSGANSGADSQGGSSGGASSGEDTDGGTGSGGETGVDSGSGSDSDTGAAGMDPCGFPLDGPWLEIEYAQAGGSPQSPGWTFSDTPGWTGMDWATDGESWPEVWDRWQNINVSSDPIGVVAVVGPSAELQLMIGLQNLVDYDYASVCLEGRSVSATASVLFDVYNPLNGCGVSSVSMAHDWSMHAAALDLGDCLEPGGGVQAVRVEPTGGSSAIGVKRLRLILHGAVF